MEIISGSYHSSQTDGLWLELRIDVDSPSPFWPVLNTFSGDFHPKDGTAIVSFQTQKIRQKEISDNGFFLYGTATLYEGAEREGDGAKFKIEGSRTEGSWKANVTVQESNRKPQHFECRKYSQFFRHVNVDIDHCGPELVLPEFDTHALPSRPCQLERRTVTVFTPFEDAGMQMTLNRENSSQVVDADPKNPWTLAELFESIQIHHAVEPDKWNVWILLASQYRDARLGGMMFDKKNRKGCAIFLDHVWHKDINSDEPAKRSRAVRKFIHTFVHEVGHCFNLSHPFDLDIENSTSFMNYDWRYNIRNGPQSYFRNFSYAFDEREVRMLRHGREVFVKPGSSAWQAHIRTKDLPDFDTDDESPKRLELSLASDKATYHQMEVVSVEVKLRNIHKAPVLVDTRLDLGTDTIKFFLTTPAGGVLEIDPIASEYALEYLQLLYPSGSTEGANRHTEIVRIVYGKDGFYFKEPGKYRLKGVYQSGDYYILAKEIVINIEPYKGSQAILDQFFTDEMGEYIALGGPLSTKYRPYKELLNSLATSDENKSWTRVLQYVTAENIAKPYRSFQKDTSQKVLVTTEASNKREILHSTTNTFHDLLKKGTSKDNFLLEGIAFLRANAYMELGEITQAEEEVKQMLEKLQARGVTNFVLENILKKWGAMKGEPDAPSKGLQDRVKEILQWEPDLDMFDDDDERNEMSGLGQEELFSQFDIGHLEASEECIRLIIAKAEESEDIAHVLEYVDALQKTTQYNYTLVQYCLEIFIQHHPLAMQARLHVPEITEPSERDESVFAMVSPIGPPQESWMDYWRNDADFVYHHQHWHNVYRGGGLPGLASTDHLDRQGELFAYMHEQMLARYDADRESWGLDTVIQYDLNEVEPLGYDTGEEFHSANRRYAPRPPGQRWAASDVRRFQTWMDALMKAVQDGKIIGQRGEIDLRKEEDPRDPAYEPDDSVANWWGHIIEATTQTYSNVYGNLHNRGHGVFGRLGMSRRKRSYMNSTTTAVRDFIFFRWHKLVDNVIDAMLKTRKTELAHDAPRVVIGPEDIVISTDDNPPKRFDEWKPDGWVTKEQYSNTITTTLDKPQKRFEWGKLEHEKFSYHLRFARSRGADLKSEMNLTFRIFICPSKRLNERRRWIEMDKFSYVLPEDQTHAVLTRSDKHSSVIRRNPEDEAMLLDVELDVLVTRRGFCECGWPYTMVLPRGTADGEDYSLLVCITDNTVDVHDIRTGCGSLSYCGARDSKYPDRRNMGYPFTTPMTVDGREVSVQEAAEKLDNMAIAGFQIKNTDKRFPQPKPPTPQPSFLPVIDTVAWVSGDQLGVRSGQTGLAYRDSRWTGRFRVVVDGDVFSATNAAASAGYLKLRFQGRTRGSYIIKNITIAERLRETLNVRTGSGRGNNPTKVTIKGNDSGEVPTDGVMTDPVLFAISEQKDYFVTFELESPGNFASGTKIVTTSWIMRDPGGSALEELDWDEPSAFEYIDRRVTSVYCLERILVNEPGPDEDNDPSGTGARTPWTRSR